MQEAKHVDVVCVGSGTEDVFVQVADTRIIHFEDANDTQSWLALEYGAKVPAQDVLIDTGGGATNCAVTFSRMGLNTAIICKVGADRPGDRVVEAMQAEGIDASYIARDTEHRTAYSIIITGFTGDRTILVYRGAAQHLKTDDVSWSLLGQAQWVYMNSLSGDSAPLFGQVAEFCASHKVKLAINPGGEQLKLGMAGLAPVLAHTTALFLNKSEAYTLTDVDPDRGDGDEHQMLQLLRDAGCENVVMTCGKDGSEGIDTLGHYHVPAIDVPVASTVGAGDAFASATIVGLQQGYSLEQAMQLGAQNSASVIQHLGAKCGILRHSRS